MLLEDGLALLWSALCQKKQTVSALVPNALRVVLKDPSEISEKCGKTSNALLCDNRAKDRMRGWLGKWGPGPGLIEDSYFLMKIRGIPTSYVSFTGVVNPKSGSSKTREKIHWGYISRVYWDYISLSNQKIQHTPRTRSP